MKKFIAAIILVVCTYNISAQKLDKVRTVDKEKKELSDEELKKKKKYIINLINLGYNDKTIRLKTSASKNQIKAIRKEIGM
ncbi:MAG: hypothetical protein CL848_04565 [Crocinitomicaceae bacterium]|nr:hypothetical protein [Crocinitomicaceae bacterium]|tara:strand:+ start:191 stop:433 length:243 start_codon:yes stop_codon:yes gene_type:complete